MADLPVLNALDELKESNEIAIQELEMNVIKEIGFLDNTMANMLNTLEDLFNLNKQAYEDGRLEALAALEAQRELARQQDQDNDKDDKSKIKNATLDDLVKTIKAGGMVAALAALGGAALGLRGWEGKAMRSMIGVKKFGEIPNKISEGLKSMQTSILASFEKFKATPFAERVGTMVENMKQAVYRVFGLGVDGKPVVRTPTWVKEGLKIIRGIGGFVGDAAKSVRDVFATAGTWIVETFQTLGTKIKAFFTGSGSSGIIGKALSKIGAFLKGIPIIGQIIGVIFSTVEGAFAAFNTEGTFADKAQAFLSTAIGDFFGAPLDLLKDLMSWVAKKFGFDETSEFLDGFSIEQFFKDSLDGVMTWVRTLFGDPLKALNQLVDTVLDGYKNIGGFLTHKVISPAWNWFKGLFGFSEDELAIPQDFNPVEYLMSTISDMLKFIYDPETGLIFGLDLSLEGLKKQLPEFKLPEFELPSFDIDFPNPFEDLGSKIQQLDFSAFNLGEWFGGALDLNLGDKLKSKLSEMFTGDSANIEGAAASGAGGVAGAEVQTRSEAVAGAQAAPVINVSSAPTTVQNNTSSSVNSTTVATASPRRGRGSPQNRDLNIDPILGA